MSRLLKQIAPHNSAPGAVVTPCLVCGTTNDVGTTDCCPAALCTPCLRKAAKTQGALFRCPLCRDDGAFVIAAERRCVVANAKDTPKYASVEDLSVRRRCDASRCKAPGGRFVDTAENPLTRHGNTSQWVLATCASCGQTSRHHGCVRRFEGFRCKDCDVQVLERAADDFRKGDRVEARFSGGPRWYGGRIVSVSVNDGYRVKYDDDGSCETIQNAARIRHRVDAEERPPPRTTEGGSGSQRAGRSRRDEDDEDGAALRALRERVRSSPYTRGMTATRLDAILVGWRGSRRGCGNGFTYSFVAPDGTEVAAISRAAAAVLKMASAPADVSGDENQAVEGGIPCEVRRVGSSEWRRFGSFSHAARALGVRPGNSSYLSRLANDDPACPAWFREQFEGRKLTSDDATASAAPAADESPAKDDAAAAAEASAPAPPAPAASNASAVRALRRPRPEVRNRSNVGPSLGPRDSRGNFPCPTGCPRTFAHASAAVQHGKSCTAGPNGPVIPGPGVPRKSVPRKSVPHPRPRLGGLRAAPPTKRRDDLDYEPRAKRSVHGPAADKAAAAEAPAPDQPMAAEPAPPAAPTPAAKESDPKGAAHELFSHLRRLPGIDPSRIGVLLLGWRMTRWRWRTLGGDWSYRFTSTGGEEFTSVSRAAWEVRRLAEDPGWLAQRLGEDPAPAGAAEVAESDATASLRAEAERLRAENDALRDDPAATVRREARLRAEVELSILEVDNRTPAAARAERPEQRAAATEPAPPARAPAAVPSGAPSGYLNHRFVDEPGSCESHAVEERVIVALWFDSDFRARAPALERQGAWMAETRLLGAAADAKTVTYHTGSYMTRMMARYRELHPDYAPAVGPIIYVPPAPAVPTWPAPAERPPLPPPPPPLLGHAGASLAADEAFHAASAAALRSLTEALGAVEALATSDFQGPMKRPVARLALKANQLKTHIAASEAQLVERMATAVATAAKPRGRWSPDEDARLRNMVGDLGARSDWRAIAARLGTDRTAGAVEGHWRTLNSGTQRWTSEEDQRLSVLVREEHASGQARPGIWDRVATAFPDRTASAVEGRQKTLASRDPNRKRAREGNPGPRWSPDEETRLEQLYRDEAVLFHGATAADNPSQGRRRLVGADFWTRAAAALGTGRTAGAIASRWQKLHAGTGEKKRWTSEEDERLKRLVDEERASGPVRPGIWDRAAAAFPDRTASAVEHHGKDLVSRDPDCKRVREGHSAPCWSPDEDARLRQVVEDERKAIAGGAPRAGVWDRVAFALGTGRTGGAVQQHWSTMNRDGTGTAAARWTPDEEQRLRRLVEAERAAPGGGKRIRTAFWDAAAAALGTHRTAMAIQLHWQAMNGARPRKKARTDDAPSPPEHADDPFGLRAGLAALFSWAPGGFLS